MMQLLKLEGLKLLPYRAFWIFAGLYTGLFVTAVYILGAIERSVTLNGQQIELHLFEFPEIWHRVAYIGSFFHYLLAFLVILAISNEFDFHTFRLQLMDGLSRRALLAGKVLLILLLSLGATVLLVFICLCMGLALGPARHESNWQRQRGIRPGLRRRDVRVRLQQLPKSDRTDRRDRGSRSDTNPPRLFLSPARRSAGKMHRRIQLARLLSTPE